jgi:FO synthase subunit 2
MMEDKITIAGGSTNGEHLPKEGMIEAVEAIGRLPVERDTLYHRLQ